LSVKIRWIGSRGIGIPLKATLETLPSARKVERLTAKPNKAVTAIALTTCNVIIIPKFRVSQTFHLVCLGCIT